jgi:hypothetical protein
MDVVEITPREDVNNVLHGRLPDRQPDRYGRACQYFDKVS